MYLFDADLKKILRLNVDLISKYEKNQPASNSFRATFRFQSEIALKLTYTRRYQLSWLDIRVCGCTNCTTVNLCGCNQSTNSATVQLGTLIRLELRPAAELSGLVVKRRTRNQEVGVQVQPDA
uniref:Uncharacterized protein n=1 Tax=Cacopsylla melanoneura TaxID=428564 RepID=A0A8D9BM28_9HEMI